MQASSNENNLSNHNGAVDAVRAVEDWTAMTGLLSEQSRDNYASWLDDELRLMEKELDRFVSDHSRYSGRR
ncbi:hypothetical protein [Rhodopirellula sp. MGV]|uniref:hypothetical protein n=1 Tax=Rhodopirellula sp. MGV TaxID=2023130 RepID=UPI000B97BC15|nr:hypothetical protein [Rhodopirellula sp. MGV]OYP28421.1 hypothetical protein CGZ80_26825 [Rhodopirellula sp. MGV]PNY38703.1 hypothetical protein C2E31_01955 [Rhodopirellula baltica]